MGTRCLTHFFHEDKPVFTMYRHFDGYPSGHGVELVDFLSGIELVNGLSGSREHVATGAGCLAAQLVAHFKDGPGGFYLYPVGTKGVGEEFTYEVHTAGFDPAYVEKIRCVSAYEDAEEFSGTIAEFLVFASKEAS